MSFLDALAAYGLDFEAPGTAAMARGMIIQNRVGLGWSNNAIQRELSQNGLGISVGQLDPMIRAERERQAGGLTSAQIPYNYSLGEALPGAAPPGWTGQYVHKVQVTWRTKDEAGNFILHSQPMTVKAADILTPAEAASDVLQIMTEPPAEGDVKTGPDLSEVVLTKLTGVWYETPARSYAA